MSFGRMIATIFGFLLIFIGGGCSIMLAGDLLTNRNVEWVMLVQLLAVSVVTLAIGLLIVKAARGGGGKGSGPAPDA